MQQRRTEVDLVGRMASDRDPAHNPQAMRNATPTPAVAELGGYELIEKVGEGGMAEVWLARRGGIGGAMKSCALKLPLERVSSDERFRKMFLSEARLALKLSHANIVSVFDAGEADGRLYMALEWIDGVDLRSFAQRIHDLPMRFSIPVVCHILGELLHALRYAHTFAIGGQSLGIIHRDISPQNVLISSSGEVKLSDFGIARVIGEETSQLHVKGKLRYMAPEQFQGRAEQASDIYAVGAILHELLEGKRFRDGLESREDWMRALLTADDVPPLTREGVPVELTALHRALLAPDPEHRVRSADDALMMLSQCDQWRNSTIELRKLYARYFNQNRRTGLTQGDGMMPAINPGAAAADKFPTGLEAPTAPKADPAGETAAEPDAPVFFRKGRRRGRPASEPTPGASGSSLSGQSTAPHRSGSATPAASVSGSGASVPVVSPTAATAAEGTPGPQHSPDAYAATGVRPEARRGEATRPDRRADETRPTLGPEDATHTNFATIADRRDRTKRAIILGVAALVFVVGGLVTAKILIGDDPETESKAATVAKAESNEKSGKANEPKEKDEPESDEPGPVIPTTPVADAKADGAAEPAAGEDAANTVVVKLRLDALDEAWVKFGTREIFVAPRIDAKLPPGTHEVSWKTSASGKWHAAESLELSGDKEHLVKVGAEGLEHTSYDP